MDKKKKYLLIGIGVVILITLLANISSCDNDEVKETKEIVLKAAQTEIKGELKGCYEVVDKNYKVKFAKKSYENNVVNVELKRTSAELPYDRKNVVIFPEAKESSADNCAGFGIEILDAAGDVIDKISANATPYSWDEMTSALQLLPDETTTIAFYFDDLSEAVSFRITSILQNNEKKKTTLEDGVNAVIDMAKEAAELSNDADLEELKEEAEDALEMAGEALEFTGKMMDILN